MICKENGKIYELQILDKYNSTIVIPSSGISNLLITYSSGESTTDLNFCNNLYEGYSKGISPNIVSENSDDISTNIVVLEEMKFEKFSRFYIGREAKIPIPFEIKKVVFPSTLNRASLNGKSFEETFKISVMDFSNCYNLSCSIGTLQRWDLLEEIHFPEIGEIDFWGGSITYLPKLKKLIMPWLSKLTNFSTVVHQAAFFKLGLLSDGVDLIFRDILIAEKNNPYLPIITNCKINRLVIRSIETLDNDTCSIFDTCLIEELIIPDDIVIGNLRPSQIFKNCEIKKCTVYRGCDCKGSSPSWFDPEEVEMITTTESFDKIYEELR